MHELVDPSLHRRLVRVLEISKDRGFLGPGPVEDHVAHAAAFLEVLGDLNPKSVADLGSGGGIPGLVLAAALPSVRFALIDGMEKRTTFLNEAVDLLGLTNTEIVCARAEELGHNAAYRETYQMVVARSFGPPAVLAECASPLLLPGGTLIVSEPPHSEADRWPASGLAKLGLRKVETVRVTGVRLAILEKTAPLDSRWPRRVGIPAKRPVF